MCDIRRATNPGSMHSSMREWVEHFVRSFQGFEDHGESSYTAGVNERPEEDEGARKANALADRICVKCECMEMAAVNQIQVDGEKEGQGEAGELSIQYHLRASRR